MQGHPEGTGIDTGRNAGTLHRPRFQRETRHDDIAIGSVVYQTQEISATSVSRTKEIKLIFLKIRHLLATLSPKANSICCVIIALILGRIVTFLQNVLSRI